MCMHDDRCAMLVSKCATDAHVCYYERRSKWWYVFVCLCVRTSLQMRVWVRKKRSENVCLLVSGCADECLHLSAAGKRVLRVCARACAWMRGCAVCVWVCVCVCIYQESKERNEESGLIKLTSQPPKRVPREDPFLTWSENKEQQKVSRPNWSDSPKNSSFERQEQQQQQ